MRRARRLVGTGLRRVGIDPRRIRHRIGSQAPAEWYDAVYATSDVYAADYRDSPYLPVWRSIASRLPPGGAVLEVGCGSGQLAQMLSEMGLLDDYVGFDFSAVAVESARERMPSLRFEVDDALSTDLLTSVGYDTVICTEVLEHIKRDRELLRRIPSGKRVLATVPDFASETHVRWFADEAAVKRRYDGQLSDLSVESISDDGWTIFLLEGRR
jgi:SAM-dependent methyltransferase